MLAPDPDRDAAVRTGMIRESQAAVALNHPHILPVFEAGEADETVYVAMRYARGGDARSLLSRLGPLPPGYAWHIIAQIASALDAAHAHGLIHRDVKPTNILLDAGDPAAGHPLGQAGGQEPDHAYLSDFGMGQAFWPGRIIAAHQIGRTLHYLSPEQIEGRALDGRADLYSLACTGFELLCGTPPFGPDQGLTLMYAQLYASPPAVTARRADLPAAVNSVLATALAKDPAGRYTSCSRFAEELRVALGLGPGGPVDSPRPRTSVPLGLGATGDTAGLVRLGSIQLGSIRLGSIRLGSIWLGSILTAPILTAPILNCSAPRRRALRPVLTAAAVLAVIVAAASGFALSKQSSPAASVSIAVGINRIVARGVIGVGGGHGRPAGGGPGHAADVERRRPDGAAPGRQPGGCVREPVRCGQPAADRGEPAGQRVRPGVDPADLGPPGRRAGEVRAGRRAGQLADGRPGLPDLGAAAAVRRVHAVQSVQRLPRRGQRQPAG